ncbi:TrkA-C domain-containing protein [Halopelagius inordinatus]|uniref:TrkA-C domain-containing protein n=1 Tax=Halopelagius inordinatus TaxID=553467 RepID=A0A1I2S8T6_9EURY|nr:TrkA C-terminal domain-containing protein [Halopelagius inordinatus]SFG47307.1 TrkA-C domain-containing protein [Halopelagius inordinatus]
MASLPLELLYGLYLGVLTGFVPALIAWALGFGFKYFTGITIPGLGVVGLGVAIAGLNGGLLALADPSLTGSESQVRLTVALLVVLMVTLYAHGQGDKMGENLPRRLSFGRFAARTLSADVVELVGGRGQVRVTVVGDVADVEGYPPLPADLREKISTGEWTFPADVPVDELETRFADRLQTEFDLADVSVTLDERARATVAAAPPMSGLSKRLAAGKRAISVTALAPTGVARGDEVTVFAGGDAFDATVFGVVDGEKPVAKPSADAALADGGTDEDVPPPPETVPAAAGGECRVTLAVDRPTATRLVATDVDRLVVRSRGVRREFELINLLRRAGKRFRRLTVREGGALDGSTLGEATVRDQFSVAVLAVRHEGRWSLAPRGERRIEADDDVIAVGSATDLTAFAEAVA